MIASEYSVFLTEFSINSIGQLIWGLSCFSAALFLIVYDKAIKQTAGIICGLFCIFLMLQVFVSAAYIIMSYIDSWYISYTATALWSLSGTIYIIMSTIVLVVPIHRNKLMRIIIFLVVPIIYLTFLISLVFMSTNEQANATYYFFFPCATIGYITVIILCHWYRKERFVFAIYKHSFTDIEHNPHNTASWSILFRIALTGITIAIISNFVYPMFVLYEIIPKHNQEFIIKIINSLIFLPSLIPLIRSLDKLNVYSGYRIMQRRVGEYNGDNTSGNENNHISDNEQAPLTDK